MGLFDDVDDCDDFMPDPPPPPDGHEYDVFHTVRMFEQAAGPTPAWALSTALHVLESNCFRRRGRSLSVDERQRIMTALEMAYRSAWRRLPAEYPREQIHAGMSSAAQLVNHWYRQGVLKKQDVLYDAKALARCFRNDCHNISLHEEMRERAQQRELFGAEGSVFPPEPPAIAFIRAA